jgi:hypothetical protein
MYEKIYSIILVVCLFREIELIVKYKKIYGIEYKNILSLH